ncbi:hypothetical protein EK21DRAFT_106360 [Setomelanomma holmii]|uniref:Uncharacterized protein n=1 Tax=Setomelanomma holmii TaxID=210430 RepID=A0A9P4LQJ4_9PLEO|nr:hypothetical protein EK21DRAFT_106360 [Setomelanomma holmii]
MPAPSNVPTNIPQKPLEANNAKSTGLSLGATVGIGAGIALIVLLGVLGAWTLVRRRRRAWAQKRRQQGDPKTKSIISPDEEIARKVEHSGLDCGLAKDIGIPNVVEVDGQGQDRVELDVSIEKKMLEKEMRGETHNDVGAYEMDAKIDPVEIGQGRTFVAELEGSGVDNATAMTIQTNTTSQQNLPKLPIIANLNMQNTMNLQKPELGFKALHYRKRNPTSSAPRPGLVHRSRLYTSLQVCQAAARKVLYGAVVDYQNSGYEGNYHDEIDLIQ